jgi:hypothetical protein
MSTKRTPVTLLGQRVKKRPPAVVPIGVGLNDEREECFCLLIADGMALAIAFKMAGFKAKMKGYGALHLYKAQRIQDRIAGILRARATSAAVGLPEVTDMLKRVYAGALHSNEFTPAHNAAFSLARLYGLVVDRAQLDVIRRPSREPDAPAERALSSWIAELPPYTSGPKGSEAPVAQGPGLLIEATALGSDFDTTRQGSKARGQTGNGAPTGPVTGTPHPRAHSAQTETGPSSDDEGTGFPSAEDLF